jgi:two-component system, OmpR family, sensor histidine kinase SenX3
VAIVIAALVGVACGVLAAVLVVRFRGPRPAEVRESTTLSPRIPATLVTELAIAAAALDHNDEVLIVNRAAYSAGVIRGNGTLAPELRRLVHQVRRDGVRRGVRVTLSAPDLTRRPVPLQVHAFSLGGDDVAIIAEDMTEEERVESVRRDFVANVGHEIKTPVGAILLLAEAALDAGDDSVAVRRFVERMQHEAGRLSRLVQELIELSRLQGGEPLPGRTPVSVDAIIDEAIDSVRAAADAKQITLEHGGDADVQTFGSHTHLVTALGNLLENAIAYSGSGTRVAVGVRRRRDHVDIAVTDEGIGIAKEDLGRIFERFYRADPARSRATGGTGLGLAIVKHVVGNHGGEVTVSSRVGVGTTFTVRLPSATGADHAPVPSAEGVSA